MYSFFSSSSSHRSTYSSSFYCILVSVAQVVGSCSYFNNISTLLSTAASSGQSFSKVGKCFLHIKWEEDREKQMLHDISFCIKIIPSTFPAGWSPSGPRLTSMAAFPLSVQEKAAGRGTWQPRPPPRSVTV